MASHWASLMTKVLEVLNVRFEQTNFGMVEELVTADKNSNCLKIIMSIDKTIWLPEGLN